MMLQRKRTKHIRVFALILAVALVLPSPVTTYAAKKTDPLLEALEYNKTLPIQSNNVENWPLGPAIGAYAAILMDAETGTILYEKNAYELMYPASTTKLMTCLLAMESKTADLNDYVPFSYDAVMSIPWDGSNMGINVGDKMTLEECLYGILVVSANEVANAVGEYIGGDAATFVNMMNTRAKELGCVNTHFNNAHGYSDPNHYTCAYDLARIGRAFFSNELLARISSTKSYHWAATEFQPDDITLTCSNYFVRGKVECEGFIGSKTGYTTESRQVLVSCAERNGMKLIAVVMKEETPYQYEDTVTLFDYGFSNFEKVSVADKETKYLITKDDFFHSDSSLFGDTTSILYLDTTSNIIVPKNISFSDLTTHLTYNEDSSSETIAKLTYSFNGVYLGSADVLYMNKGKKSFIFDETNPEVQSDETPDDEPTFIYINYIIYGLVGLLFLVLIITLIIKFFSNYHFAERRRARRRWGSKKPSAHGPDYQRTTKKPKNHKHKDLYIDIR